MINFIKKLFSKKEEDCSFRSQDIVVEKRLLESKYIGAMQFDREHTVPVPFNLLHDLAINHVRSRVIDYYFECVKLLSSTAIKDRKNGLALLNQINKTIYICFRLLIPFRYKMTDVVIEKIGDEFYIEGNHICTIKFSEIDRNPVISHYEPIM